MKHKLSEQAKFLLETKHLFIKGKGPDLHKIKKELEEEMERVISVTITKQEENYIEATFSL